MPVSKLRFSESCLKQFCQKMPPETVKALAALEERTSESSAISQLKWLEEAKLSVHHIRLASNFLVQFEFVFKCKNGFYISDQGLKAIQILSKLY